MNDLYHNIKIEQKLTPAAYTATQSPTIDTQGYQSVCVVYNLGQSGDTLSGTDYWVLKLKESDDDVTYTDVVAADMFGGVDSITVDDPAEDGTAYVLSYKGSKRYLKAVVTPVGTHSNGTIIGITALLGDPGLAPVV